MKLTRYDLCEGEGCGCHMEEDGDGEYVKLADVERDYIPRPDPEEARKAIAKVKRLVKTQCEPCRRHGLTEEIAEAEAALLRLMGEE